MNLQQHPGVGAIVRVDLNEGFRIPEMRKRRPCVILSPEIIGRDQLCTIVPFSTTPPRATAHLACEVTLDPPLPWPYDSRVMWAKADMVMTVAFHRLKLLDRGRAADGIRLYDIRFLTGEKMEELKACVARAIGLA